MKFCLSHTSMKPTPTDRAQNPNGYTEANWRFTALFTRRFGVLISSILVFAQTACSKETTLSCEVIPPILQGYVRNHVNPPPSDEELEARLVDQFIERLDPSKVYLHQSDLQEIKKTFKDLLKTLGKSCAPIQQAHAILIKRLEENEKFAKSYLEKDFKFQENTELLIDPKQRKNPSSVADAQEFTKKFIQFQISNYLATDIKIDQAKKQLAHRYELQLKRQKDLKPEELYGLFIDAFAASLDAHSGFLGRDTLEDFEISMQLSLEGIGAALTWEDGYTTVDNLIPGGSAERSGEVQPKDKILAVGQGDSGTTFENVIDMPLRDVVRLIRGKKGTTVRLTLLRQSGDATVRKIVKLKRDKINLEDDAARLTFTTVKRGEKSHKIAIVDLPSFYGDLQKKTRSSYEDMKKLILKAKKEKAEGMILDLSRNGGGLLTEAVRIGGLFIKKGNIVATQASNKKVEYLADEDSDTDWSGPLLILTSRLSASASEIVSGAMKDYQRALIVGSDNTFGKGTVQAVVNLPADLGALKVTTGMFFIPSGQTTQYQGVPSDIFIPSPFAVKEIGEKSLENSLQPQTISRFASAEANSTENEDRWTPVTSDLVKKLRTLSETRVTKDPEFKKIKDELEETQKKKGVLNLAQSLKKQKEENQKEDSKKTASSKRSRKKTEEEYLKIPAVVESVQILSDWIELPSTSGATASSASSQH